MSQSMKALQAMLSEGISTAEATERFGISRAAISKAKHRPSKKSQDAKEIESLRQQLAESQATNGMLREALNHSFIKWVRDQYDLTYKVGCDGAVPQHEAGVFLDTVEDTLALPNDATALNELIAERTKELERMLEFTSEQHRLVLKSHDELTAEVERLKLERDDVKAMALMLHSSNSEWGQQNAELTAQRDAAMKDAERWRLDRLGRECLRIGREIQRAAGELPEGFEIQIHVESGAGTVMLYDEQGESRHIEHDEGLSYGVSDAIDAAIANCK